MIDSINVVDCSECPCLNTNVDDIDCNLSYDILRLWGASRKRFFGSKECKLHSVNFADDAFLPRKTKATETNPKEW